jgi:hypothetical protein
MSDGRSRKGFVAVISSRRIRAIGLLTDLRIDLVALPEAVSRACRLRPDPVLAYSWAVWQSVRHSPPRFHAVQRLCWQTP